MALAGFLEAFRGLVEHRERRVEVRLVVLREREGSAEGRLKYEVAGGVVVLETA